MVDDPALLGAAILAVCLAKAPRRTVQAVASTVMGVLLNAPIAGTSPATAPQRPRRTEVLDGDEEYDDSAELLEALRASRRARRKRKKEKRRAAKVVAAPDAPADNAASADGAPRGGETVYSSGGNALSDSSSRPYCYSG